MTNKPDSAIMAADRAALERRIDHGDLRHLLNEKRRTHVIVGDHPPEPRVVHEYRDAITGLMCTTDADGYQRVAPIKIKMIDYGPGLLGDRDA